MDDIIKLNELSDLEVFSFIIENLLLYGARNGEHEIQGVWADGMMGDKSFCVTRIDTPNPGTLAVYHDDKLLFTIRITPGE